MKTLLKLLLPLFFIFNACFAHGQNTWSVKSSLDTGSQTLRQASFGFTLNNKAYLIGGADCLNGTYSDVQEYNPTSDVWTQKNNFPGVSNINAMTFVINNEGYVVCGLPGRNGVMARSREVWRYNMGSDSWTQLNNFPTIGKSQGFSFCLNGKGYIGCGSTHLSGNGTNDFWEYDPVNDSWVQKTFFPGGIRRNGFSFAINNKGYIGSGSGSSSANDDFWEYDPIANSWTQKSNYPGGIDAAGEGFVLCDLGYVTGGSLGNQNIGNSKKLWCYNPKSDSWSQKANLPGIGRSSSFAFSLTNNEIPFGYICTGTATNMSTTCLNDLWQYEPTQSCWPTGIHKKIKSNTISISPNPSNTLSNIEILAPFQGNINVYNSYGQIVYSDKFNRQLKLNNNELVSGVYFVRLSDNLENNYFSKLVVY